MKKTMLSLMAVVMGITAQAQYQKLYFKNLEKDFSDYSVSVSNAVNTANESKFKIKITNKTNDYLIFKPEESKVVIDGKEYSPKEKWLIIGPGESDARVVNIKGSYMQAKNYTYLMDGMYKVPVDVKGLDAPDFKLPPASTEFKVGGFNVSMGKMSKESDETKVNFDVLYAGNQVGLVFFTRAAAKMPDGNEYATVKPKAGLLSEKPNALLLLKGAKDDFTVKWERMQGGKAMDMQKQNMNIIWHGTFVETKPEKAQSEKFEMEFDQATSDAKGK
jgi:archaellum component FlaF (FlaF/FlaG flagellin family)